MKAVKILNLIKDIPKGNFIDTIFTDEKESCCVIGHIMRLTSKDPNDYSIKNCGTNSILDDREEYIEFIRQTTLEFNMLYNNKSYDISIVNNGLSDVYIQEEIKDRVVAMLEDMIENGY